MQTGIYQHYKGGYYQVLGIAEHTETKERLVIYITLTGIDLEGPRIRARPVNGEKGWDTLEKVDGILKPRFVWMGDELFHAGKGDKKEK